jgi:urocanate hydratase
MKWLDKEVTDAKEALASAPESKRSALTDKNAMEILPRSQDSFEWADLSDEPKYIVGEEVRTIYSDVLSATSQTGLAVGSLFR